MGRPSAGLIACLLSDRDKAVYGQQQRALKYEWLVEALSDLKHKHNGRTTHWAVLELSMVSGGISEARCICQSFQQHLRECCSLCRVCTTPHLHHEQNTHSDICKFIRCALYVSSFVPGNAVAASANLPTAPLPELRSLQGLYHSPPAFPNTQNVRHL